ncbi:hypothetical protein RSJ42_01235 [Methanosarcina hadiensis]|uniref:hypothetical protein n=1 Tax=Methanosarcina hadiensis TaxID=3078083 RepID=UPI0039777385
MSADTVPNIMLTNTYILRTQDIELNNRIYAERSESVIMIPGPGKTVQFPVD